MWDGATVRHIWRSWTVSAAVLSAAGAFAADREHKVGERRPAIYSAACVREMLAASQARLTSFRVQYIGRNRLTPGAPPGLYVRVQITAKSPSLAKRHFARGYQGVDWPDDVLQQNSYLLGGRRYEEYPLQRMYTYRQCGESAGLSATVREEPFYELSGLWPFPEQYLPRGPGRAGVLRDIALCEDYLHVRDYQEEVGSRWCHVLEKRGGDCLWLDVERGACLLAREIFNPSGRRLAQRIELSGHRELSPGIWMPSRITSVQYDVHAPTEELSQRKVADSEIEIVTMSVNDVDDAAFELHPAAGSLSRSLDDPASEFKQTEPGGLDYLDDLADWVLRHSPAPTVSADERFAPYGYVAGVPLVVLAVLLGAKSKATVPRSPRNV